MMTFAVVKLNHTPVSNSMWESFCFAMLVDMHVCLDVTMLESGALLEGFSHTPKRCVLHIESSQSLNQRQSSRVTRRQDDL